MSGLCCERTRSILKHFKNALVINSQAFPISGVFQACAFRGDTQALLFESALSMRLSEHLSFSYLNSVSILRVW